MTSGMLRQVNNKGDTSRSSLPLTGRYVLRAACLAQNVACPTNVTCPKGTTNLSVCLSVRLSAQLLFSCCGMPLIVMDLYQNLIMSNISLVNAAAQPRLSVRSFVRLSVRRDDCPVVLLFRLPQGKSQLRLPNEVGQEAAPAATATARVAATATALGHFIDY